MNNELVKKADEFYQIAEQKAAYYFKSLHQQVVKKSYISTLTRDIQMWKSNHVQRWSLLSIFSRRKKNSVSKDYHNYIKWLDYTGELDSYLERSIAYIFMRDLGKTLDDSDTEARIQRTVNKLRDHLTKESKKEKSGDKTDSISTANLYRKAQEEGIEATMIWLVEKLKTVASNIPAEMNAEEAQRKLIKIIAGVTMHQVEEMGEELSKEARKRKIEEAIRLGYSYGLTYPFIDDLLDAKILSIDEEEKYSDLIRTTLVTGTVPELGAWHGNNQKLIGYVHSELKEAFEYIKNHQKPEKLKAFLDQAYVFFNSQEVDRIKDINNEDYSNEEIFIPIILKSASSRLITRSVIGAPEDIGFDNRTFFYGIYNQLADDFADMFDDMKEGAVTPYTYYMKYYDKRSDLINPFELYWTVISNLIHNVYNSDTKTCEVILDRAVNGLKRFKERMGNDIYNEVMEIFSPKSPEFNKLIQDMVEKAENVDFFDKLLRDHMVTNIKNEQKEKEEFSDIIETVRKQVNESLDIPKDEKVSLMEDFISNAANYSLRGDGKRLRPIMAWVMGVKEYGLKESEMLPLLRSLEYMHTASLIFDDLPAQDNADIRRGRPTVHKVYNVAIAELTGLFLTQKAIEEQTFLQQFDLRNVLKLIRYSTETTADLCKGQTMDLEAKGKQLTLEQLNMMCFYKTGKGFEAALMMPAILAARDQVEMEALKKFSYHAGIAFQIKDDLLDVEGEVRLTGKKHR